MSIDTELLVLHKLSGVFAGQETLTQFWFRTKAGADYDSTPLLLEAMLDEFEAFILNFLLQCASIEWQVVQAQMLVMAGDVRWQAIRSYTTKYGTRGSDSLPPHDAMLVSLYTPYHDRRLHGRLYIPAIAEDDQFEGLLSDAHLQRLDNFGSLLVTRYGENGNSPNTRLAVFSRKNGVGRLPGPPPSLHYNVEAAIPITRHVAHRVIATQRHRRRSLGTYLSGGPQ